MDEFKREKNLIDLDKESTQLKKEQFIKKIKGGLGDHIKKNGNKIINIKKTFFKRFLDNLKEVF